ncbi:MAG: two-component system, sporulation sensor kinase [Thermoanaerobacterium sp.]|uniref:ATP-binding protein n=1 Tax=Thermoanaerobacterium sp. CMT5567-10 TaxID=3061989 RepID=UPI00265310A4|nr:ATP-binding protein [Thermoanaerobacterium sp. CMT5567-10]MDK2805754.1 two-component system, sporulation sensor kinase [Thermoanaerobacterium sp.]MDN5316406.1 two-component system, sporulation sensor kinase [Thermoanaerobacterium sp.]WKV07894.1 ATP-binding protein [Thermoanaerobacterium sp. CMT5567-10]
MDDVVRLSESLKYKWIFDLVDVSHKFIMLKNFEGEIIYINNVLLRLLGFNHDDIGENYDFFFKNFFLNDAKKVEENIYDITLNSRYGFTLRFKMVDNFLDSDDGCRICIISTLNFVRSEFNSVGDINAYLDLLYNRFRIIDMVDTGIILIDKRKHIEYVNKAACNLMNVDYKKIFHKDIVKLLKSLDESIEFDEIMSKKIVVYNIKSSGRFLSIEVADTYDDKFFCLVIKDVTEKLRFGEIIEKSEKFNLMGALAVSLIHEIKNSITSIKGFLQLMQLKDKSDPAYFDTIISESDRIIDLVMSYLGVMRNSSDEDETDLNDLIEKYMVLIEAEARQRQIEIIKKLNEVPVVKIDNNQLKQILLNVFQNSFQAIGIGGKICLTTRFNSYKNKVIIKIADNGCGIDRENLKKVAMPLFTTKKDGTGLGLSICKNILSKYGGDLKILSKKGVGTIVNIYLELKK